MAEIDPKLRRAKQAVEKRLLNLPGVTGVDIGFKEVGGKRTDELAIRVLVRKKRDVRPEERVPASIEGFPTDVIERRYEPQVLALDVELLAQADTQEYETLMGGISIGPCRPIGGTVLGGTLGLPVRDNATGKVMLLSNFHVLCGDNSWSIGDSIAQPARIDQGRCPASAVASVQRGVLNEKVDCAVAELTARTANSEIVEIGEVRATSLAAINQPVRKRGRTTGLTYGFVDAVDVTTIINYPGIGEVTLTNQVDVRPDTARNAKFSDGGDSGAAVVNAAGEIVGLHFAGNPADGHGAFNPIAAVLSELNVAIIPADSPGAPPPEEPGTPPRPRKTNRPPMLTPYPPTSSQPLRRPEPVPFPPLWPLPRRNWRSS